MSATRKFIKEQPPGLDPRWPYRPIRLLLVDDETAFVDTLTHRLIKRGFRVSSVYSGADGVQLLKKANYDVAIVDLKMEGMDGINVLKIFRKLAPDLPVIILTGLGTEKAVKEGMACGAFGYLSKPCEFEDLLSKITLAYHTEKEPLD